MNKQDRKHLMEAYEKLTEAQEIIASISSFEQEKFDNLSEGLQYTPMGLVLEGNVEKLDTFSDEILNTANELVLMIE